MTDERNTPTPDPEDLDVDQKEAEDVKGGHTIVSPRDPASGQATGKRSHKPIATSLDTDAP